MSSLVDLSPIEKTELTEKESEISSGLATFEKVGRAFAFIRDNRLYREEFETFREYCAVKWNKSDRTVRQILQSVEVVDEMRQEAEVSGTIVPLPTTETQVRELSKVEPEKRNKVFSKAVEQFGEKPTADQIKEVACEIKTQTPPPSIKPFDAERELQKILNKISEFVDHHPDQGERIGGLLVGIGSKLTKKAA